MSVESNTQSTHQSGAWSCRFPAVGPSPPFKRSQTTTTFSNRQSSTSKSSTSKFLASELHMPAVLLRILLLRAGVEANPGPPKQQAKFPCPTCRRSAFRGSFQCSSCRKWVHMAKKCSNINARNYNAASYLCPVCMTTATPNNIAHDSTNCSVAPSTSQHNTLRFMQWNANGINNKRCELEVFLRENKVDAAAIQETKLKRSNKDPKIAGYRLIRRDRPSDTVGGGLAFLIRSELVVVDYTLPPSSIDGTLESQAVSIATSSGDIILVNIYVPPASSCPPNYVPPLIDILDLNHAIVLGDFNAHHHLWHSSLDDARGLLIADLVDSSGMLTLNENTFTRCPTNADQRLSSPDITLACSEIAMLLEWKCVKKMGSDHLPILLSFDATANLIVSQRTTFVNFNKADWPLFKSISENLFSNPPAATWRSVHQRELFFRSTLIKAAKEAIPFGRRKLYNPSLSERVIQLTAERDALRIADRTSARIAELNLLITKEADDERRRKWQQFLETLDRKTGSKKLWNTIKALDGKSRTPENTPINFDNKLLTSSNAIANAFVKMFTTVRKHTSSRPTRRCNRAVLKKPLSNVQFTPEDISRSIKASKNSKAFGPDQLCMPYLKHIGPNGLSFLTELINASFSSAVIPDIWKTSTIVPLPKPGKDPKLAASYRPISLLSPVAKLLERLLLPSLHEHLPPASHQHGFRPGHSTTTALLQITNAIATGFNDKKPPRRTMVVAVDLSKAFDSVDLDALRTLFVDSSLPGWATRWLSNYLRGRIARASFRNTTSSARICRTGVPQGSVISPALFNAYLRDLPQPPPSVNIVSYADDITVFTSGVSIAEMEQQLTSYLSTLANFLDSRKLTISAAKSSVTLFTPDPAQYSYRPNVMVKKEALPLEQHPKILGVTFDPKLTFNKHAATMLKKVQQKNQVLKALVGRSWGQNKETVLMTYKATSRAIINYAAAAWTPSLSRSNFDKLQCKQNDALRAATGCLQLASVKHLHQETRVLPVQLHCRLLTDQFYVACRRDDHPCRHLFGCPGPPRRKKQTLALYSSNRFRRAAAITRPTAPQRVLKAVQHKLHEKAVHRTRTWIGNNSVINAPAPDIRKEEESLSRTTRAHLAQFRSGFSHTLATTRSRFDKLGLTSSRCPNCPNDDEDVVHVFACPSRQITCNILDLWYRPSAVAAELGL